MAQHYVPRIQVIGSLNMDLVTNTPRVPAAGETLTARSFDTFPGGKGANQAIACARALRSRDRADTEARRASDAENSTGRNGVSMVGAVGKDAYGDLLLSTLARDGISCEGVLRADSVTTGVAVILVEEASGENRILITPGANGKMVKGSVDLMSTRTKPELLVMQLEIPLETVLDIIRQAKQQQIDVLLNPAPAVELPDDVFNGLAHLVLNETEAAILCHLDAPQNPDQLDEFLDRAFQTMLSKGVRNIVITLGASGVAFACPHSSASVQWQRIEAQKVDKVVDTTAAGDTFVGYYAVSFVAEKRKEETGLGLVSLKDVVVRANKAAALTVTRQGAMSSIPYSDELA